MLLRTFSGDSAQPLIVLDVLISKVCKADWRWINRKLEMK